MLAKIASIKHQGFAGTLTTAQRSSRWTTGSSRCTARLSTVLIGRSHRIRPSPPWTIQVQHKRTIIVESLPNILVPPVVFTGLLLALWAYKCAMTVLFQDKIIYMPYMPPFARSEKVDEYSTSCLPVRWHEQHIKSLDGTKIALCVGSVEQEAHAAETTRHIVVCYFQGNGSSLPPRLPLLSSVLKATYAQALSRQAPVRFTLVALSYRGYWTSSGRATERGIRKDSQAMLRWIAETYGHGSEVILWGQSIGAGVACAAAAEELTVPSTSISILGLILETPFTSIKSMLLALYPQKWLPYQYLWPFLWNHWDNEHALRAIASSERQPKILLLPARRDEVVPAEEANKIERLCETLKLDYSRVDILGALHTEATTRREGQEAVARFLVEVAVSDNSAQ